MDHEQTVGLNSRVLDEKQQNIFGHISLLRSAILITNLPTECHYFQTGPRLPPQLQGVTAQASTKLYCLVTEAYWCDLHVQGSSAVAHKREMQLPKAASEVIQLDVTA